jgi:hypothetical protein
LGGVRISSSDRLALENISSSSSSSSRNSGGTREARAFGARAKHALVGTREERVWGACEARVRWHARSACVGGACEARVGQARRTRWARASHALGTREARAFAGFNEHPLVNY